MSSQDTTGERGVDHRPGRPLRFPAALHSGGAQQQQRGGVGTTDVGAAADTDVDGDGDADDGGVRGGVAGLGSAAALLAVARRRQRHLGGHVDVDVSLAGGQSRTVGHGGADAQWQPHLRQGRRRGRLVAASRRPPARPPAAAPAAAATAAATAAAAAAAGSAPPSLERRQHGGASPSGCPVLRFPRANENVA